MSTNDLNELYLLLGRIEGKVDSVIGLADRVSKLERHDAWQKGALAALTFLVAWSLKILPFLR